jgi:predicted transcriptional regulator
MTIDEELMRTRGATFACLKGWVDKNIGYEWDDLTTQIIGEAIGVSIKTSQKYVNELIKSGFIERNIQSTHKIGNKGVLGSVCYYRKVRRHNER